MVRKFEAAFTIAGRTGEGPLFMAEELTLNDAFRKGGTIYANERFGGTVAVIMDGLGNQLLAHAAFPPDKYGRIAFRHF